MVSRVASISFLVCSATGYDTASLAKVTAPEVIALSGSWSRQRTVSTVIRSTVTVEKSIEEVFDYAAQFDRHPEWQDDLKSATAEGAPAVGATGSGTRQIGPRVHTTQWRMSAYERPSILGWEVLSGPMRPAGSMRFSAEGTRTRVDLRDNWPSSRTFSSTPVSLPASGICSPPVTPR